MDYDKQVKEIAKYFKSHEKTEENFKIGVEFEHFVIEKESLKTVSYYGDMGIEHTLKELLHKGWKGEYEGAYLLGLSKEGTTITLEPGSQLELSIKPCKSIEDIEVEYRDFLKQITPILESKNQTLMTTGYQPMSKINDIEMIPKERYSYMFEYFKEKGYYAHNMMKGTASVQLAIDYKSEEDYIKKFKVLNALSPVLYAMFDNSAFFEGAIWNQNNLRACIWSNCDLDRCGIVDGALDNSFGYEKYAEYILNRPPILMKNNGDMNFNNNKLFKDLFNPENYSVEELEHVFTMFFPDVRTKKFIEIRMMDAVPYPLNFSIIALWKGILYNQENLDVLYQYAKTLDIEDVERGKKDIVEKGLDAVVKDQTIYEIGCLLINLSKSGLQGKEIEYLIPFEEIFNKKKTPASITRERLALGKIKALEWCMIDNFKWR